MRTLVTLACITAMAVATAPASASPVGGMAKPGLADASAATATPTVVVRELHTVVHERDSGRTLALVLAATALGVAFLSVGVSTRGLRGARPQA